MLAARLSAARLRPRIFQRGIGEQSGLGALAEKTGGRRKRAGKISGAGYGDPLADSQSMGTTVVDSYTRSGFVVNGVVLPGAVLLLPTHSLLFSVPEVSELTPRSLEVLRLLDARTDLLIIGCGRQLVRPPLAVREWTAQHGIAAEPLSTQHACSTFNFMVQEQRSVAAVLFPVGA